MRTDSPEQDFARNGPRLRDQPLFLKRDKNFVLPAQALEETDSSLAETREISRSILAKIAEDMNAGRHAEAAIRFALAQNLQLRGHYNVSKRGFDPAQTRNERGEWSKTGNYRNASQESDAVAVSSGYCKIVKQLCIVEATATLPTSDFGVSFFRAMNSCMERHGCLGRA